MVESAENPPLGTLLYDGACPRCRRFKAWIDSVDIHRRLATADLESADLAAIDPRLDRDACRRAMHLVRADGRILTGYDAVVDLLRWFVPGFAPIGALCRLPVVASIGRWTYNALAARRRRFPCDDSRCDLPPRSPRRPLP